MTTEIPGKVVVSVSPQCWDVIVLAFPGTLLLSEWIATKAIPGKTRTNHIPEYAARDSQLLNGQAVHKASFFEEASFKYRLRKFYDKS